MRAFSVLVPLTAGLAVGAGLARASAPATMAWTAEINGRNISSIDSGDPLRLPSTGSATIKVTLSATGSSPVTAKSVRLDGRVAGLDFFSFTTLVNMSAAPGRTDIRVFTVQMLDLGGQATGLMNARVSLLDDSGHAIASRKFAVDVRGSIGSVYGVFGLAVAGMTLVLLVSALFGLFTGRLHPNRWRRAMTFSAPGFGIGFVLTFTLSALRLMLASTSVWVLLILLGGAIGFTAGYLSPVRDFTRTEDDDTGSTSGDEASEHYEADPDPDDSLAESDDATGEDTDSGLSIIPPSRMADSQ